MSEQENEEKDGAEALTFVKETDKFVKNIKISTFNLEDFLVLNTSPKEV